MTTLFENENYVYSILTTSLKVPCKDVEVLGFLDEPLTVFLQPDHDIRLEVSENFCSMFTDICANNGLSVVCVSKADGSVAGCFWVRDYIELPVNYQQLWNEFSDPVSAPLWDLLDVLDAEYESQRPKFEKGDCADLWMLAVHPAHRQKGIAKTLTSLALDIAKKAGFRYIILESLGSHAAKCAASCGMKPIISYDYANSSNELLKKAPPQHPTMTIWELQMSP